VESAPNGCATVAVAFEYSVLVLGWILSMAFGQRVENAMNGGGL